MTYREFLDRPQELRRRVEHQIEDVNFKWAICTNTTSIMHERVQSTNDNKAERSYIMYIESKRRLDNLNCELDDASNALRDFLYDNLEPGLADILEWRYIDGKSIREIAAIRGITYESAKNKVSKASKKLERYYTGY